MYKGWIQFIFIFGFLYLLPSQVNGEELVSLHSEAAIVIDAQTGEVIYEKNAHQQMYPASITKIVTGMMAIESGRLEEIATTSKKARWAEGTRVYLAQDEKKRVKDLTYGLLMHSGNDAAIVIAEHLAGNIENFVLKMNRYTDKILGPNQTNFTNPHGLFDEHHVTTAYDMAMLSRHAMKHPVFREIVGTKKLPWHGEEWETNLVNHNKLLWRYDGATGIKNGYTSKSRNTLVASAKRGATEFIAVGLKAPGSEKVYKDITALLDYGFDHFETKRLFRHGMKVKQPNGDILEAVRDFYYTIPKDPTFRYEIEADGDLILIQGKNVEAVRGMFTNQAFR